MSAEIKRVGVIGAGTMGNGIAQTYAAAGYPVFLNDLKPEYLDRGMATSPILALKTSDTLSAIPAP